MISATKHYSNRSRNPSKAQRKGVKNLVVLVGAVIVSVLCINDYISESEHTRILCMQGKIEEVRKLVDDRNLVSNMVAYIDEIFNGEMDICGTDFPDTLLWDEYPPIVHSGGDLIPHRPAGTIAYVLTITRCPDWYEPAVDGTPDPGDELYEMTAVIKNEICTTTDGTSFTHTL